MREKRVLIYGAGDAGEMIVRDMRKNPYYEYEPVGFVDDDASKVGLKIHGLKVLGTSAALGRIMADTRPDAVLVAIARAAPQTMREIVNGLEPFKVPIQRLPSLRDLLDGKVTVGQIRTLSIEDLLERAPVTLDRDVIRGLVEDRNVLVTGAGGFIGRELCRQILPLAPRRLTILDRYENGLYATLNDLEEIAQGSRIEGEVADVTNADPPPNDHGGHATPRGPACRGAQARPAHGVESMRGGPEQCPRCSRPDRNRRRVGGPTGRTGVQ
jgi:FlaA1/EpsC-like NDP-sugar epimerase